MKLPKLVRNFVYNSACSIIHIAHWQIERGLIIVLIAQSCIKLLQIVHEIVMVLFADAEGRLPGLAPESYTCL